MLRLLVSLTYWNGFGRSHCLSVWNVCVYNGKRVVLLCSCLSGLWNISEPYDQSSGEFGGMYGLLKWWGGLFSAFGWQSTSPSVSWQGQQWRTWVGWSGRAQLVQCTKRFKLLSSFLHLLPKINLCFLSLVGYYRSFCRFFFRWMLDVDDLAFDKPVSFFSNKLNTYLLNYSMIGNKALMFIWALKYFDVYVGSGVEPTLVYTDHNPLIFLHFLLPLGLTECYTQCISHFNCIQCMLFCVS